MSHILVLSRQKGQVDRRILAELNTLSASGRSVTFVSVPALIPAGSLSERVRVIMPPVQQATSALATRLKRLAAAFPVAFEDLLKIAWHCLHLSSLPNFFLQMTPTEAFDAIHCHDLDTLPAGVLLRQRLAPHAKIIYDSHELFPFQYKCGDKRQRDWSQIERTHIHEASLVVTVNTTIAQELSRLYGITKPEVIYNSYGAYRSSTTLTEQEFLRHFTAPAGGFRVIFPGAFIWDKNLANLVRAFQYLPDTLQLFLLGTGPAATKLQTLARKLRLSNVFFGSWVPQEHLLQYLAHAHLGIIPYTGGTLLNNLYCTPNKLFEFIEVEIPVCASDLPELRRIVVGHGIGDVYPMEDPKAIAHALQTCHARCLRGEFTVEARRAARALFAWDKQGEKLLTLYQRIGV
ncbi:MAG: glycosyltransferase family 4 protein [Candidatus Tectomicrobia bacterium]|uniref:Glycosyltransferase family 4 protein n=1 Tax=Tectimicrobiota bacterium TaxID=2528274 RepID=A0A937VZH9_UNCTE|nr:glycosyltransferase family 4 protein [Candidatus Tectomicrobia bacterium]